MGTSVRIDRSPTLCFPHSVTVDTSDKVSRNKHLPGGGLKKKITFGQAEVSRWWAFRVHGTLSTTNYSPEGSRMADNLHLLLPSAESRARTAHAGMQNHTGTSCKPDGKNISKVNGANC